MPDTVEPVGQNMHEEAADELEGLQPQHLHAVSAFDPVILPFERDGIGISADQAVIGDRDAVGVSAEIGQHRLRSAKGWFGVDHPVDFAQGCQPIAEGTGVCQSSEITEEPQLSCTM